MSSYLINPAYLDIPQARYFEKDIESGVCWLGLNGEKKIILNESYRFNLILFHELLEVIIMRSSRY